MTDASTWTGRRGRLALTLTCVPMGEDLCVALAGGDRPHIGAVALAQARPSRSEPGRRSATTSVLALLGHREDELARTVAARISAALGATVCVACGIHLDALAPGELGDVEALVGELVARFLAQRGLGG